MRLKNIVIQSREVPVDAEQSFTVNGVSANQAFLIFWRHRDELTSLFDRFNGKVDDGTILNSVEGIIASFPLLVGELITIAQGGSPFDTSPADPDFPDGLTIWQQELNTAMNLPLPVQVDALLKIGELTFTPEMPPKKFFGLLVGMIQQATIQLTTTSDSGSDS